MTVTNQSKTKDLSPKAKIEPEQNSKEITLKIISLTNIETSIHKQILSLDDKNTKGGESKHEKHDKKQ